MTTKTDMMRRLAIPVLALWAMLAGTGQAQAQDVVYYHTDALGTPVAMTDATGTVIQRREFEPYGHQLSPETLADGPGFTGHVSDAATGLVYMQQRYYDPELGVFPSTDPVTANSPGGTFNRYWYANNNPYKFTDPDGRQSKGTLCSETSRCETGSFNRNSHSSQKNRAKQGLTTKQYQQLLHEYDKLYPRLSSIGANSPQATADQFGAAAVPFTSRWGFEIGANIIGAGSDFHVADVTLGYFGGVTIPENLAAVADVHTHPSGGSGGFSGAVTYSGSRGLSRYPGDLSTNYARNIDGYVYRTNGEAWRFNQAIFRSDLANAMKNGTTIDARWSFYVEQIR